jgi:hypothetical protein
MYNLPYIPCSEPKKITGYKLVYKIGERVVETIVKSGTQQLCYAKKNTLLRTSKQVYRSGKLVVEPIY